VPQGLTNLILNDPKRRSCGAAPAVLHLRCRESGGEATLDDLFRRAAARRPDGIALIDPPNRDVVTEGAPRC